MLQICQYALSKDGIRYFFVGMLVSFFYHRPISRILLTGILKEKVSLAFFRMYSNHSYDVADGF